MPQVELDPLRFLQLTGCRKRRLNQALSVLSLSLVFFLSVSIVLLTRDSFKVVLFYVICMFCHLVVLVMLTVPVQVIYSSLLVFVYYNFNTFLAV